MPSHFPLTLHLDAVTILAIWTHDSVTHVTCMNHYTIHDEITDNRNISEFSMWNGYDEGMPCASWGESTIRVWTSAMNNNQKIDISAMTPFRLSISQLQSPILKKFCVFTIKTIYIKDCLLYIYIIDYGAENVLMKWAKSIVQNL